MSKPAPKLKVGDRVFLRVGNRRLEGRVIEDRGALGVNGAQIVRIMLPPSVTDDESPQTFEMPAAELLAS